MRDQVAPLLNKRFHTMKQLCSTRTLAVAGISILLAATMLFKRSSGAKQAELKKNVLYYYTQGVTKYQIHEYTAFVENLEAAVSLAPNNPKMMFTLARACALKGQKEAALTWLARALNLGYYFELPGDPDFSCLRNLDAFGRIMKMVQERKTPVHNSEIAFCLAEKDLMPEGIAFDPVRETFYIGSYYKRKILSIAKDGCVNDFVTEGQDGLWNVAGIRVDAERRILWINSAATGELRLGVTGRPVESGVFAYDLDQKKFLKKYTPREIIADHAFNDMVVTSSGDLFVTDSLFGAVYRISRAKDSIEVFIKPKTFTYPNGIAISENEQFLYVAHEEGISAIDLATRSEVILTPPEAMTLCGIDGLYYHRGSLVAIQSDNWKGRIIQFYLRPTTDPQKRPEKANKGGKYKAFPTHSADCVAGWRIIESGNPIFEMPTTGVIVGNEFYYIANSQLNRLREGGEITSVDKLNSIYILRFGL